MEQEDAIIPVLLITALMNWFVILFRYILIVVKKVSLDNCEVREYEQEKEWESIRRVDPVGI